MYPQKLEILLTAQIFGDILRKYLKRNTPRKYKQNNYTTYIIRF